MINVGLNLGMDMHAHRRQRLRAIIQQRTGGNAAQFARETGIDEARLSQVLSDKYREGKNFGEKSARAIEAAAGLSPMELDKIEESPSPPRGKLALVSDRKEEFHSNASSVTLGKRAIPVISAIQAGAAREIAQPYEPGDGSSIIFADDEYSKWAFALIIEGDSMLPEFKAGDLVIIDPEWEPRPGDYVAAKNGKEEATFKKYRPRGIDARGNEIFELTPLNDDYPTLRSDITPLTIIGVMAEHRRKSRRR